MHWDSFSLGSAGTLVVEWAGSMRNVVPSILKPVDIGGTAIDHVAVASEQLRISTSKMQLKLERKGPGASKEAAVASRQDEPQRHFQVFCMQRIKLS